MSNQPLVSVIVPTYNRALTIGDTIKSLQAQSYENWECLVVDDCSIDNTRELVGRITVDDPRVKYVATPGNGGVSRARNLGLEISAGEFIQLLDSDDLIGEKKLESQVAFLQAHDVDIVYSGSRYFESNSPEKLMIYGRNNFLGQVEITKHDQDVLRTVLIKNPFVISAPLYRRSVFERVGVYDTALKSLEDWDFQIRCAIAGLSFHFVGYTPETGTHIRLHEGSLMRNDLALAEAFKQLISKHKQVDQYGIFPNLEPLSTFGRVKKGVLLLTPPLILSWYRKFRGLG